MTRSKPGREPRLESAAGQPAGVGALLGVEGEVAGRVADQPASLGTRLRAKLGRQHPSRIVRWTGSTAPFVVGRPGRMNVWTAPSSQTGA